MTDEGLILAVVTARAGSKRLPNKNILEIAGKPLIAWSIEAGLGSGIVDKLVVSTDDQHIADIGKSYGGDVPFMRPDSLATDTATSVDVVLHMINSLEESGQYYKYLLLLQPTSPLRTSRHIADAYKFLKKKNAKAVISVCEVEHPVEWINTLPDDCSMDNFLGEEVTNKRSQDFPIRYRLNGAIYIIDIETFKSTRSFIPAEGAYAFLMDLDSSVDIDTMNDFRFAEVLLETHE